MSLLLGLSQNTNALLWSIRVTTLNSVVSRLLIVESSYYPPVHADSTTRIRAFEDFVSVKDILAREIGLPITLETCYKFLVLLPLEAHDALKHYYGITYTNELVVRGIEARRHDAPNFIKDFQSELLYTLFR
ncbi:MAG: hypothetical protein WBF33_11575 [Candidatus Nitrosopolaris sp.]